MYGRNVNTQYDLISDQSSAGTNTERPQTPRPPERVLADKAIGTPPAQTRRVSASTSPMPQSPAPAPAPKPATPPPRVEAKMQTEADLSALLEQIDAEQLPSEVADHLHKILDEVNVEAH